MNYRQNKKFEVRKGDNYYDDRTRSWYRSISRNWSSVGIGIATGKAVDAVARQPEADSKISKNLLLGCALAEATAIYGMVVAILIIFLCK